MDVTVKKIMRRNEGWSYRRSTVKRLSYFIYEAKTGILKCSLPLYLSEAASRYDSLVFRKLSRWALFCWMGFLVIFAFLVLF